MVQIFSQIFHVQVDAYEVKNQELMSENADLKALLRSMQVCNHCIIVCSIRLLLILYSLSGGNEIK